MTAQDLEYAKVNERKAHRIKMAMYDDQEFMAGIQEGYAEEQRGEMLSFAELRQALGRA